MLYELNSYLMARFYDRAIQRTERLCLGQWRRELLANATGQTLEIGAGTGINLPYYPQDCSLQLSEPDRNMRRRLMEKTARSHFPSFRLQDWAAEAIPVIDASFDTIVSTLVLCSVVNLQRSAQELYRLLKPGGQLLFIEHVLAEGPQVVRWQKLLNPCWKFCCGNCHLTRNTGQALTAAGFHLEELMEAPLLGAPAFIRRTIRGTARKPE